MFGFNKKGLFLSLVAISVLSACGVPGESTKKEQKEIILDIVDTIENDHYKKIVFNDTFSETFYYDFFDKLDPMKFLFLQSDVDSLKSHLLTLDNEMTSGNLEFGLIVHDLYKKKSIAKIAKCINILENHEFNFDLNDRLLIDKDAIVRASSESELELIWIKQMKHLLIMKITSGSTFEKARLDLMRKLKVKAKTIKSMTNQDSIDVYINTLTSMYDPHTNYFSPVGSESFQSDMSLSLEGIGAMLEVKNEYITIVSLTKGGPAFKQGGLKPGDKLVAVGQGKNGEMQSIVSLSIGKAVGKIRGEKGSIVRLEVLSDNETKIIEIIRDEINMDEQSANGKILDKNINGVDYRIGVITLPSFYMDFNEKNHSYKSASKDVRLILSKMKISGIDGLVVDLRGNGGGSLVEAIELTDIFIDKGPVVQIKYVDDDVYAEEAKKKGFEYTGPLLVLIDTHSASSSEIFAGAIQDYGRGIIAGENSYGKGTVQEFMELSDGSALKYTMAKFYRISGDSTQIKGVRPDVKITSLIDKNTNGEKYSKNSLDWSQIKRADYTGFNIDFKFDDLNKKSQLRKSLSIDLQHVDNQYSSYYKTKEKKSHISLNLSNRQGFITNKQTDSLILENKYRTELNLSNYQNINELKNDLGEIQKRAKDTALFEARDILLDHIMSK